MELTYDLTLSAPMLCRERGLQWKGCNKKSTKSHYKTAIKLAKMSIKKKVSEIKIFLVAVVTNKTSCSCVVVDNIVQFKVKVESKWNTFSWIDQPSCLYSPMLST